MLDVFLWCIVFFSTLKALLVILYRIFLFIFLQLRQKYWVPLRLKMCNKVLVHYISLYPPLSIVQTRPGQPWIPFLPSMRFLPTTWPPSPGLIPTTGRPELSPLALRRTVAASLPRISLRTLRRCRPSADGYAIDTTTQNAATQVLHDWH